MQDLFAFSLIVTACLTGLYRYGCAGWIFIASFATYLAIYYTSDPSCAWLCCTYVCMYARMYVVLIATAYLTDLCRYGCASWVFTTSSSTCTSHREIPTTEKSTKPLVSYSSGSTLSTSSTRWTPAVSSFFYLFMNVIVYFIFVHYFVTYAWFYELSINFEVVIPRSENIPRFILWISFGIFCSWHN